MALHVTNKKRLLSPATTQTAVVNSSPVAVGGFIEGRIFVAGDVVAGTWDVKVQQQDPITSVWFDRNDTFTSMTATGGLGNDGLNQQEAVAISNLGSVIRVVLTPSVAPSPDGTFDVVFEGKS